jgi:hypothetical protein
MFGKPVSTPIGNVSMEDIVGDYNIGDVIILENLLDAILNIEGLVEDEDSVDMTKKMKSVKDAVDGLNDRALEIFDTDLFDGVGENLRWVLGV